jgi:hypothetical protein
MTEGVPSLFKKTHVIIFDIVFLFVLIFGLYKFSEAVSLVPENNTYYHTNLLYFDGVFSASNIFEDANTALYIMNQSDEYLIANIYEYDKSMREQKTVIQIPPRENRFIKTDGPGVIYLNNYNNTAHSIAKFSRYYSKKKYFLPQGFKL